MSSTCQVYLCPGLHRCNNLIETLGILQFRAVQDLPDHFEKEIHFRIKCLTSYREHSLKLFCRISSVKNLYPTVDTACIGIDFIEQFSVCVILCIHITQYGFQKSQIRNLLRRNTVSLKHQVYVTDAICAYVMVKEQTVIYR